ncbi:response regulator [Microvirga calopogonii]|uniref:response regulator n=1 Tax=Microvirga calopogonii TaxID=2078013 RepID=UPI001FDF7B4B|nr:response regulator [Microvirga calopogonii]
MTEPDPMPGSQPEKPLVLICEDEVLVRMLISDLLQDGGFKVIEAKNVAEALRVLEARPDIQVLFTDVEMPPGPNGYELAQQVCERWPYIQIIISSGRALPVAGDMPDCAVFLRKPWTAASLTQHVQEAADRAMKPTAK